MAINLTNAAITPTYQGVASGITPGRTFGERIGEIVNVKDFGAKGDGLADDTLKVQAALDAAFGPASNPHGQGGVNRAVYFPRGGYKTTAPLVVTSVWGGKIYGDGMLQSGITYTGPVFNPVSSTTIIASMSGAVMSVSGHSGGRLATGMSVNGTGVAPGTIITSGNGTIGSYGISPSQTLSSRQMTATEGWTPTLWLNGFNYCEISNIGFGGPSDPTNHKTVCLWWAPDGGLGGSSAHGCLISNVMTGGPSYGSLHGSLQSAANSENTYFNCALLGPHDVGLFCSGANTLNMKVYGGGIDSCGIGIKTNNAATVTVVEAVAFANNGIDVDLAASGRCVISGIRTESIQLLRTNTAVTILNSHGSAGGNWIFGSVANVAGESIMTVTSQGTRQFICYPGQVISGTDAGGNTLPNSYLNSALPTQGMTKIVEQRSGAQYGVGTYLLSQLPGPGNIASGTKLSVTPIFVELMGAASATLIDCGADNDHIIAGDGNGSLAIINNQWFSANDGAIAPHLLTFYKGQVLYYDIAARGEFTYARLPPPMICLRGVRMFIHDSTVTTFGTALSLANTGGSITVPIYCDGAAWRVG